MELAQDLESIEIHARHEYRRERKLSELAVDLFCGLLWHVVDAHDDGQ